MVNVNTKNGKVKQIKVICKACKEENYCNGYPYNEQSLITEKISETLGYAILGRQCKSCGAPISMQIFPFNDIHVVKKPVY